MKKLTPDDILLKCLNRLMLNELCDSTIEKIIDFLIEFGFVREEDGEFVITTSGRELLNLPTD